MLVKIWLSKKVKSFPSHMGFWNITETLGQTCFDNVILWIQGQCITWHACLTSGFCWCTLLSKGWPGWVNLGSWLRNVVVYTHEDGDLAQY